MEVCRTKIKKDRIRLVWPPHIMVVGFPAVSYPRPVHLQMLRAGETMAGLVAALSSSRANVLGIALVGNLDDSATSGQGDFLGLKVGFGGWIMFGARQCSALLGGKICVTDNRDNKYNPMSIIENSNTRMWNHQPIRCLFPSLPANAWQEPKQWETTEHSNGYGTKTEVGQFRPSNSIQTIQTSPFLIV